MADKTPSITHKYIPRVENQRENNLFLEEYYSSTDTHIYFDDIEQTEIGYIGYSVQEQLKPLYGYSSYTYDDMAVGNRIVTGTFKVPIKNPDGQNTIEEIQDIIEGKYDVNSVYNQAQEDLINQTEWIDNTANSQSTDDTDSQYEDDEQDTINRNHSSGTAHEFSDTTGSSSGTAHTFDEPEDYVSGTFHSFKPDDKSIKKLQELGYDVNTGSSLTQIQRIIRKFQNDNNISDGDGMLTENTITKLNELYAQIGKEIYVVHSDTRIYSGPEFNNSFHLAGNQQTVHIQMQYENGWALVYLESGEGGYIHIDG